jgi:uncharacterized phage-associated protein
MRGFDYKKATQALNYFSIKEGGIINKMKAIKLIWLSDRLHLRKYARTVTGDTYFALPNGPVPSSTRDILEQNEISLSDDELKYSSEYLAIINRYSFKSNSDLDYKVFSQTDTGCLDTVYGLYGQYDQYQLRDLSHFFPEWKKYESALNKKISSRFLMDELDFFSDAPKEVDFFESHSELASLSKEVYLEDTQITNFLR